MPVEKFHNKYRIGTKRASWHDYNGGEYFITICTNEPSPCISADGKNKTMQKMANDKGRLSIAMGGFKQSVVASWRAATPLNTTRHHMNQIAEYIENNVAKWESDNSNQQNHDYLTQKN